MAAHSSVSPSKLAISIKLRIGESRLAWASARLFHDRHGRAAAMSSPSDRMVEGFGIDRVWRFRRCGLRSLS
jgi:hypothetical protein